MKTIYGSEIYFRKERERERKKLLGKIAILMECHGKKKISQFVVNRGRRFAHFSATNSKKEFHFKKYLKERSFKRLKLRIEPKTVLQYFNRKIYFLSIHVSIQLEMFKYMMEQQIYLDIWHKLWSKLIYKSYTTLSTRITLLENFKVLVLILVNTLLQYLFKGRFLDDLLAF